VPQRGQASILRGLVNDSHTAFTQLSKNLIIGYCLADNFNIFLPASGKEQFITESDFAAFLLILELFPETGTLHRSLGILGQIGLPIHNNIDRHHPGSHLGTLAHYNATSGQDIPEVCHAL